MLTPLTYQPCVLQGILLAYAMGNLILRWASRLDAFSVYTQVVCMGFIPIHNETIIRALASQDVVCPNQHKHTMRFSTLRPILTAPKTYRIYCTM